MTNKREHLDQATTRRLAQLAQNPIDTTELERKLDAALQPAPPSRHHWHRPALAVAAMFIAALTVALITFTSNTTSVHAATIELSQLHRDLIAGEHISTPVTSIAEANTRIHEQENALATLPQYLAETQVQSCCLADAQGKLVAAVLMEYQNQPTTLVVAEAENFAGNMGDRIIRDDRTFYAHQLGGIEMVMAKQNNRWLCVMGDLSREALLTLAAEIRF